MRVLMLSWRGPRHPKAGGAEVYTAELLRRLVQRGYDVEWHSARYGGEMPTMFDGISLTYGAPGMRIYVSGHFYARSHKADVIVDQINTFGFLTPRSSRKTVSLIHQLAVEVWDAETKPPVSWIGKWLEPKVLSVYANTPYITISPSTQGDLHRLGWKGRGFLVPNGIDAKPHSCEKTKHPTLVFLARLGANAKRLDHAVRIFEQVREHHPEARLWVIGRGDPPGWLGQRPGIELYQNVSDEVRDRLIGQAWCCLATSIREGWGRMVLESAMMETPSVVYNVHGLRDAVMHGRTGYVVSEQVEAAARCITDLFYDPDRLAQLGRDAKQYALTFSWETSADRLEEALHSVVGSI